MTDFSKFIREVPDFPQPGILFKDITPLLQNPCTFRDAVDAMAAHYEPKNIDVVVGIDARGFIFGSALSYRWASALFPSARAENSPIVHMKPVTNWSMALIPSQFIRTPVLREVVFLSATM